jgi:tripartite-type tricarboxylate transporter receptor subunit TctC
LLCALIAVAIAGVAPFGADAQAPIKSPIRILTPFADDASYAAARLIGDDIGSAMARPVVVERRAGATGRIAAAISASMRSKASCSASGTSATAAGSPVLAPAERTAYPAVASAARIAAITAL